MDGGNFPRAFNSIRRQCRGVDSAPVNLSATSIEAVAVRTADLIRSNPPRPLVVDTAGAMSLLACDSTSAFHRERAALKLRPYRPGKYRVADIEHALARASQRAQERTAKPFR